MMTLSLSVIIGGVFGFLWPQSLLTFMWLSSLFEWAPIIDGSFATQSPYAFEDSRWELLATRSVSK